MPPSRPVQRDRDRVARLRARPGSDRERHLARDRQLIHCGPDTEAGALGPVESDVAAAAGLAPLSAAGEPSDTAMTW